GRIEAELAHAGFDDVAGLGFAVQRVPQEDAGGRLDDPRAHRSGRRVVEVVEHLNRPTGASGGDYGTSVPGAEAVGLGRQVRAREPRRIRDDRLGLWRRRQLLGGGIPGTAALTSFR